MPYHCQVSCFLCNKIPVIEFQTKNEPGPQKIYVT